MLVTELIEALKLNISKKEFMKFVRQIVMATQINKELTPTTDDDGNGNYLITKRGEIMFIDLMVSTFDFDGGNVATKSQLKGLMQFNLRWYHTEKDAKNEK